MVGVKSCGALLSTVVLVALVGCGSSPDPGTSHPALTGSGNGISSEVPAYYDGKLFTITLVEQPPGGESAALANNTQTNNIYEATGFIAVLDAIQGDGFNPLWQEVDITFTAGHQPHQFFRDDAILAAAAAGEITLTMTGELYRCSVVGPGPK